MARAPKKPSAKKRAPRRRIPTAAQSVAALRAKGLSDTQIGAALGGRNSSQISQIATGRKSGELLRGALNDLAKGRKVRLPEARKAAVRQSEKEADARGDTSVQGITNALRRAVRLGLGVHASTFWGDVDLQEYHSIKGATSIGVWGGRDRFQSAAPLLSAWESHVASERKKGASDRAIVESFFAREVHARFDSGEIDAIGNVKTLETLKDLKRVRIDLQPPRPKRRRSSDRPEVRP